MPTKLLYWDRGLRAFRVALTKCYSVEEEAAAESAPLGSTRGWGRVVSSRQGGDAFLPFMGRATDKGHIHIHIQHLNFKFIQMACLAATIVAVTK